MLPFLPCYRKCGRDWFKQDFIAELPSEFFYALQDGQRCLTSNKEDASISLLTMMRWILFWSSGRSLLSLLQDRSKGGICGTTSNTEHWQKTMRFRSNAPWTALNTATPKKNPQTLMHFTIPHFLRACGVQRGWKEVLFHYFSESMEGKFFPDTRSCPTECSG